LTACFACTLAATGKWQHAFYEKQNPAEPGMQKRNIGRDCSKLQAVPFLWPLLDSGCKDPFFKTTSPSPDVKTPSLRPPPRPRM
ncbi:hypothetical protein BaRGS_00004757, partial [Batillaria attramentaria]